MKKSMGFTAIEGLLIIVIVGILGGTGWYVWNARNKTSNTYNKATQVASTVATSKKSVQAADPTADWIAYSSKDGEYSLKYPKSWVTASSPDLCSPGILLLGADSSSVGACGSGNFGQISVVSSPGDSQKDSGLSSGTSGSSNLGFENIVTSPVTVDNIKGEKQTGTASGAEVQGPPGLPKGTQITVYIFFDNNRTYVATYRSGNNSNPHAFTDVSSDYNLMVTKTLKFSS